MKLFFKSTFVFIFGLASILSGCASSPSDSGFADVQKITADRTGQIIRWRSDTRDDQAAHDAVRSLLEKELTANQAVQIALLNNHHLQATYEELGIAQADVVQAGLLRNPVFDASVRFPDGGGQTNPEFSVSEDFLSILWMPLRKKVAAAKFDTAKFHVASSVLEMAAETETAFYTLQSAEQILESRHANMAAADASAEAAKNLHDAGNITDLEFANRQIDSVGATLELSEAEADVVADRERLNMLMGTSNSEWKIASRLPDLPGKEVDPNGLESLAISQRLDLSAAREEVSSAIRSLRIAQPFGGFSEAQIGVDTEHDPSGEWLTGPTLSLPIPLFDQGQGMIARSRAEVRAAREKYAALIVDIHSEVRAASARMFAARTRADYCKRVALPLHREIVQQTQLQYNAMQVGIFQLLTAKQGEIDAERIYVGALRDYWIARAELTRVVGGKLPNTGDQK